MIAQGVDAIVIAPADSKALVPVCKRAMDAGIIVVNIDNKFDAEVLKDKNAKIPFVGPDNRKGARLAGEYLAHETESGRQGRHHRRGPERLQRHPAKARLRGRHGGRQ